MDNIRRDLERVIDAEVPASGRGIYHEMGNRKFRPTTTRDLQAQRAGARSAMPGQDNFTYLSRIGGSLILPRG